MAKSVTTATVRLWARENIDTVREFATAAEFDADKVIVCLGESARGRLHPVVREAYTANHKGHTVVQGIDKPATMVEQPYRALNTRGARITKTWKGTTAEARALYGSSAERGRVNTGSLLAVLEAPFVKAEEERAQASVEA